MPSPTIYAEKRLKNLATGPTSPEGKSISSQNALKFGLFATRISSEREQAYEKHGHALLACLTPANPIEHACAREIIRATWRLDRCAEVEETNDDPRVQTSVDRARAQALNTFLKSTAELRRLQTNRRISIELHAPGTDLAQQGIAAQKEIVATVTRLQRSEARRQPQTAPPDSSFCKTPETIENAEPQIARNAPCPCHSGEKYKRCCGRNAPPVLFPQKFPQKNAA